MYELQLISGVPVNLGVCEVHPLKIRDIALMGESEYNRLIGAVNISKGLVDDEELKDLTSFDVAFIMCASKPKFRDDFISGLSCFLKEPVTICKQGFQVSGGVINKDNYDSIIDVIRKQNCVSPPKKEKEYNPANEKARKLVEKIKKNRAKAPKVDNSPSTTDLVSSVAWRSGVGLEEVLEYTMYQLYNAFYRLNIVNNYDNTMLGIYTGNIDTKKSKINYKDTQWFKKIKDM